MSAKKKNPEADSYYPGGDYKYAEKDAGGVSNAKVGTNQADLSNPALVKARDGISAIHADTTSLMHFR